MSIHTSYRTCKKNCSNDEDSNLKKDVKQLKADNLLLIERIDKLEKLINNMISYQPEGEGYQETKTHFETINIK
jgi:hypothetical protein